jgi:hypothetical protein
LLIPSSSTETCEFCKKAAADIGTADVFTHLVELHQKQRAVFLKDTARKNN